MWSLSTWLWSVSLFKFYGSSLHSDSMSLNCRTFSENKCKERNVYLLIKYKVEDKYVGRI